jgi:DNA-damage-inducible protein J
VDEDVKKQFDTFCENVGMNLTTAMNMFMRAVIRTRQLPFTVTDVVVNSDSVQNAKDAIKTMQSISATNGTDNLTMDDIDSEIAAYRNSKRTSGC